MKNGKGVEAAVGRENVDRHDGAESDRGADEADTGTDDGGCITAQGW